VLQPRFCGKVLAVAMLFYVILALFGVGVWYAEYGDITWPWGYKFKGFSEWKFLVHL
jgi:hypothetical protein